MRGAVLIGSAWLAAAGVSGAQPATFDPAPPLPDAAATLPDPGSTLPAGPVKPLVLARCDKCHGLTWIEKSGANEQGWTDRIRRMNRAGAMVPAEEIPILAAYLAEALPERPRPSPPPRRHSSSARH